MNNLKPSEFKFEEFIEKSLNRNGIESKLNTDFDSENVLINDDLINFIKETQNQEWVKLTEIHGLSTESKFISRISSEIGRRGVIDVLRNRVVDRGVYFDLCFFEPRSTLNKDHEKLYNLNKFKVVRQVYYSVKNKKSIDMVIFLNGIPIFTMELKNQLTGQNIKNSEFQYKNDRDPREPLLQFKRCLAHFCVDNNQVSMTTKLSGVKTQFLPFNKNIENPIVENNYRSSYLWEEILTPKSILDLLENFAHIAKEKEFYFSEKTRKVETDVKNMQVFPRYHQINLIRKLKSSLLTDGVGTNYLIQHATGSGKSYSIGWLAHMLTSLYSNENDLKRMFDSIIVVTDRTVLDDQLRSTIMSLEKTDGVVNGVQHGSKELREFLEKGKDIIITTIQKFPFISESITTLKNKKFAVIIDEVHSSQSGEFSKEMKKTLSKLENDGEFDYEDLIRQEIQNRGKQNHISFFGFTGTPKEKTLEIFGTKNENNQFEPFDTYSMNQSIQEGFTLNVLQNYVTYKRYFKLKQIAENEIELPVKKAKKQIIKYVDNHKETIENKVNIILDHWVEKGSKGINGRSRGMIVTQSRKLCVQYFFEINRQLKERGIKYKSLVGFSGEVKVDGEGFTEGSLNRSIGFEGVVPFGLKNPDFRLLIVANKFQTGFDEPLAQSMYVDKKLDGVQCVQTLSRLNRVTLGKDTTFILDFANEPAEIQNSFQRFFSYTILENESDPNLLYDTKSEIEQLHLYTREDLNRFCEIFFDLNRKDGELHPYLDLVVDKYLKIEDQSIRDMFKSNLIKFTDMYSYMSQIITFTDIELEKTYIFFKYLLKKLPKQDYDKVNILDSVELESLRIQKTYEKIEKLTDQPSILNPEQFTSGNTEEVVKDLLEGIINDINEKYGVNLSDEDKVDLERLKNKLQQNSEIKLYLNGENSEDSKKSFFSRQFENEFIDSVNERIEFYNKIEDNSEIKKYIIHKLYSDFRKMAFDA
jgi:type I restriction enzyme R subunit